MIPIKLRKPDMHLQDQRKRFRLSFFGSLVKEEEITNTPEKVDPGTGSHEREKESERERESEWEQVAGSWRSR